MALQVPLDGPICVLNNMNFELLKLDQMLKLIAIPFTTKKGQVITADFELPAQTLPVRKG